VTGALGVSFVIPVLNAGALLDACLASIRAQEHPRDRVEILVMDGGSTDDTRAVAERHGARVVDNPLVRAEPGVKLGLRHATHDVRVIMAADNRLPDASWLTRLEEAFADGDVRAAYTHVVPAPGENTFCRYFNRLHADPFNWFVFGAAHAHPARFGEVFPVVRRGPHHAVYDLRGEDRPLLAMAQAFALRGDLDDLHLEDDIAPVWEMVEAGEELAYFDAGVHHDTVAGFRDFLGKYHRRTKASLKAADSPQQARSVGLGPRQRRRRLLWIPYSLSIVLPLADAIRGALRDRDPVWLLHPIACLALTGVIVRAVTETKLGR
jgi:glycosyltransferase involved in cell wall biosynthesis